MDLNKFTERSKEIFNSAQVLAMMQNHQQLQPVHLLNSIIEDDDTASRSESTRLNSSHVSESRMPSSA